MVIKAIRTLHLALPGWRTWSLVFSAEELGFCHADTLSRCSEPGHLSELVWGAALPSYRGSLGTSLTRISSAGNHRLA